MENLEQKFLDDMKQNCRVCLTIGEPDSGKTFMILKYIIHSLNNNIYDEYHLVIPQFNSEKNDSYEFLKQHKNKVFIYLSYDPVIIERISKIRLIKKVFFMVDDGTGELDVNDKRLLKLASTSRHGFGCCIWLIAHASKKVIGKGLRGVVKYIFINSIDSVEMLEKDIYNDYVSMTYRRNGLKFDDFFNDYNNIIENNEYGCFLIARRTQQNEKVGRLCLVDLNVNQWNLYNEKENKKIIAKKEPEKHIEKSKNHSIFRGLFKK